MTIASVLRGKGFQVETVAPGDRLGDAVRRLGEKRIGAMPVVEDGRIVGIISERDVIYCLKDHDQSEGAVTRTGGSNRLALKSYRMSCV